MSISNIVKYPIPLKPHGGRISSRYAISDDQHLCSVLERIATQNSPYRQTLYGLPWLTPIAGSGCLQLGDGPSFDVDGLRQKTGLYLERLGLERRGGSTLLQGLAGQFAEELYVSRMHEPLPKQRQDVPVTDDAVRLTVFTAILTRLYHMAASAQAVPLGRNWVADRVSLLGALSDPELLDQATSVSQDLADRPMSEARYQKALVGLLSRIDADLTKKHRESIAVLDLRLLTELTWIELTYGTSIYPGWSDFLLSLLADLSSDGTPVTGYRPRIQQLRNLDQSISRLLIDPTKHSWRLRANNDDKQERRDFYDSLARLLHQQARIHSVLFPQQPETDDDEDYEEFEEQKRRVTAAVDLITLDDKRKLEESGTQEPPTVSVPHPAAYVTSFDLELEMALWAAGKPFRVVLPVFSTSGDRDADLVWLTTVLDPTNDRHLDLFASYKPLRPKEGDPSDSMADLDLLRGANREWRVAEAVVGGTLGHEAGGRDPVVVRVTGSPLMKLPQITGQLRKDFLVHLGMAKHEAPELEHALAIDEYSSVRESEHELYFAANNKPRGLPAGLSDNTTSTLRVWVGFGVQVDDPAIRMRMFTQLSAASIKRRTREHARSVNGGSQGSSPTGGPVEDQHPTPTGAAASPIDLVRVRGLAVNRRLDEDQSLALQWLGFEFIVDRSVGDLTPDIVHCGHHYGMIADRLADVVDHGLPPVNIDWGRAYEENCPVLSRSGE